MKEILHPALYERLAREIGNSIGLELIHQTAGPPLRSRSLTQENLSPFLKWLRSTVGWIGDTTVNDSMSTVTVSIPRCPFGNLPLENPYLCQAEASMIGSAAGEYFGYAKVSIVPGEGSPPTNCRFTIHLERTPASLLVEGPSFPLEREKAPKPPVRNNERLFSLLSLRERQIVKLVGEGLSDKEIASALRLSVRTVEGHVARIRSKTGLRSRNALIRFALQMNEK
ncbi:MAG: LuxR C-terminal-related transcriptional regulator [Nitrospira sp.]|nr:LuxR C-terminal-related transcriptional regulator [Nitrospira sp.]